MTLFSPQTQTSIEFAADLFRQSRHAVILTGAGLSTPSGIPDFRSTGTGLWSRDEPLEVASLSTFRTHPESFFNWFRPLASQIFYSQPNPAHLALAELEQRGYVKSVITQNIDMLHQKAGSKTVIEMHGTMETLTCSQCYHKVQAEAYIAPFVSNGEIPHCPQCGQILKPDVILFGEQLPQSAWFKAQKEARQCDLMLVAGSSLEVLPVAGLPMQALDRGAHLIILNNTPTYLNVRADVTILEDVSAILPAITEKVING
ncbi:MAG TPA: NAD-dependent deacylase [Anaerolineales bacterium]|jgi:NAD-dependent deacetylase|nr:RNA polymerase subunit sigma [Anaerolineae bacterium]HRJ54890.1 NAD-dependent deacylase [Anaerolineales bacterium]HRK89447.1 NAD-dependent deacylase [Anaerolineales bacterium]